MTALDDLWKELIADSMRRNVVVSVGKHRLAIEAAIRGTEAVDVERLARALAPHRAKDGRYTPPVYEDRSGWRYMDDDEFAEAIAHAYAADSEPS